MIFKKKYLIGAAGCAFIIVFNILYFLNTRWFNLLIVVSLIALTLQFWFDILKENKRQKEVEEKFMEFVNALVGSIKSGIPVPQAIVQVSDKDYGELTPYVKKLANQAEWGIPVSQALLTFANDTKNSVIKRAISIVIETEQSGGEIEDTLTAVAASILDIKKLKAERKASVHSQVVQGYIVFYVFISVMLILQLKLIPQLTTITGDMGAGILKGAIGEGGKKANLDQIFFILVMIQGFFAGLLIGKFSEGTLKDGLIHSLILISSAALIITTIKGGL